MGKVRSLLKAEDMLKVFSVFDGILSETLVHGAKNFVSFSEAVTKVNWMSLDAKLSK